MKTRIIVAGSRSFDDYSLLESKLDELLKDISGEVEIVSGNAKGADTLGEQYALNRGLSLHIMKADWKRYGRRAGFIRNKQMLDYASEETPLLVAFWDGFSNGTRDMIERTQQARARALIVLINEGVEIDKNSVFVHEDQFFAYVTTIDCGIAIAEYVAGRWVRPIDDYDPLNDRCISWEEFESQTSKRCDNHK